MLLNTATLSLATLSTVVGAQILAEFVPNKRTVLPSGGWSLSSFNGGCPFDAPQCGATWCCPTSLTCVPTGSGDVAEVCCPASIACETAFQGVPVCADNSWALWNTNATSNDFGYFCCLPGQIGLATGECALADQIASNEATATLLSSASGATATGTSTASSSATGASTASTTGASSATLKSVSPSSSASSGGTSTSAGKSANSATETASSSSSSSSSSAAASSTSKSEGMSIMEQGQGVGAILLVQVMVAAFAVGLV